MPVPYPLIRALLPLCLGIWAGDSYPLSGEHLPLWGGLAGLLVLLIVTYLLECQHQRRTLLLSTETRSDLLLFPLTLFLTGVALVTLHRPAEPISPISPESQADNHHQAQASYLFELLTAPQERARTYVCKAKLLAHKASGDSISQRTPQGTYLLYIHKEEIHPEEWHPGELLAARTALRPFTQLPDSNHFDYPTYARRRGWSGTAYLPPKSWTLHKPLPHTETSSWASRHMQGIATIRQQLITHFRSTTLDDESIGLITALTLGQKELLPAETKATFARTGVSHLLALSGLHIGILYALLLLPTLPLRRRFVWLRSLNLLLVLLFLWGFALLTGLSASVVRSVTMYSLLTIGLLLGSPVISLNKLAAAALLLLVVRPYWLFDVGFQLSCTGVASILYLAPPIHKLYKDRPRWERTLWSFVTISTAAQIGTAPLVASYFGTFSPYFLIANGWSIPIVTLLLYLSIGWMVCLGLSAASSLPFHPLLSAFFPTLFGSLTHLLNDGLHFIQQLPYACIGVPRPDSIECILTYLILLLLPLCKGRHLYTMIQLILLLIWLLALYHYFLR